MYIAILAKILSTDVTADGRKYTKCMRMRFAESGDGGGLRSGDVIGLLPFFGPSARKKASYRKHLKGRHRWALRLSSPETGRHVTDEAFVHV